MATISNENKNSVISISNISKVSTDDTWEEATYTWEEAGLSTWELQRVRMIRDSKNSTSVTNDNKN